MNTLIEKHGAEIGEARAKLIAMLPSAQLQASKNTVLRLWEHLQYPEDLRAFLDAAARIEAASLDQALWEKVDADRRRWVGAPGASPLNHTWFLKRLARLDALSGDRRSDEGPDRLEAGAPPAGLDPKVHRAKLQERIELVDVPYALPLLKGLLVATFEEDLRALLEMNDPRLDQLKAEVAEQLSRPYKLIGEAIESAALRHAIKLADRRAAALYQQALRQPVTADEVASTLNLNVQVSVLPGDYR
jgi:hypothetical protein